MATTATFISATRFYCNYSVAVDAAGGTDTQDVLADLVGAGITSGPLYDLFNNAGVAYLNQAAARLAMVNFGRVTTRIFAEALGGGTGYCTPTVDFNVAGGGAVGNFRVEFAAIKQAGGNTMTYLATIEYRHSIVR